MTEWALNTCDRISGDLELTELEVQPSDDRQPKEQDLWGDGTIGGSVLVNRPAVQAEEGLPPLTGSVTPPLTGSVTPPPGDEEEFDVLPSAHYLTMRTGRKKTLRTTILASSTSSSKGLLPSASGQEQTDDDGDVFVDGGEVHGLGDSPLGRRRGHLRSQSARSVPRVRFESDALRRTSSLPRSASMATNISITILDDMASKDFSRTSTMPLAARINFSRQVTTGSFRGAKVPIIGKARDVWWPKVLSFLKEIFTWELWRGHMKVVEGNFGTGVVSYFIFLRWLLVVNLLASVVWLGFVLVPQVVWRASPEGVTAFEAFGQSKLSCLLDPASDSSHSNVSCSSLNTTQVVFSEACNNSAPSFQVGVCRSVVEPDSALLVSTTDSPRTVYPQTACLHGNNVTLTMCLSVEVYVFELQYVIDVVTGQGIFNTTILFIGQYFNGLLNGSYDYPVAFLLTTGAVYITFIIVIILRMGQSFSDSYSSNIVRGRRVDYCNKVFTAWDFNISERKSARLLRASIRTSLEETLRDEERRNKRRSTRELVVVVLVRAVSNVFVLLVLVGEGAGVYYAVQASTALAPVEGLPFDLRAFIAPVVISVLNFILPIVFQVVARFERYKTQSGEVKVTLFRAILVRLASVIVLVISLFSRIRCTQPDPSVGGATCSAVAALLANVTGCDEELECWETVIGQEFYTLVMFNFGFTLAVPVVAETAKNLSSKFLTWKRVEKLFTIKGIRLGDKIPREFDLPKSILDLIYTQSLLWLGLMFSPVIPFIVVLNLFLLFYVKRYSLTLNLVPSRGGVYRSARINFTFILLLLAVLLGCFIPFGFTVAALRPSQACGPFRTNETFFAVIEERIDSLENCQAQAVAGFFSSVGFLIPLILLLFMSTLGLAMVARARGKTKKLLERQLHSESSNVSYLMERVLEESGPESRSAASTLQRRSAAYIPRKTTSKARRFKNRVKHRAM